MLKNPENRLAIDSGVPTRALPFAVWPEFADDEIFAACAVLRSGKVNYWTGDEGLRFEEEFARYVGCKHAVAVANGTVALELALRALGIGPGDEVVVPARTFIASASSVALCGAVPVVADVDRSSQNLTAATIEAVLSSRTRAVIAVHLNGWPCDMNTILGLARDRGLKVIEDCAQAHGATYKGRKVGSLGDAAAFSFCQDKIMSTGGEGGMITTNDAAVFEAAWSFKDHGKNYRALASRSPSPAFRWVHDSFATNARMTEMQAAMGRVLLRKLDRRVAVRRENARVLMREFSRIPGLRVVEPEVHEEHAYYKYYAFVRPEELLDGWQRDRIAAAIRAEGIPCTTGICSEIYLETAFSPTTRPRTRLPVARELGETSLMFLVHSTLSESDMLDTARAVEKVMSAATPSLQLVSV